ncbi:MAG: SRPBCC family protein [Bacteroidota bacterium]
MKVYKLERIQFLPIKIDEAWDFFSSPRNLKEITPDYMKFVITYISGQESMYAGQLISYIVHVLPGIPVRWTTEITHVEEPSYFVDEQRFGPYALWHHQHHFKEVEGGIEMTDIVNYAIPWGILGRFADWLFVGKKVKSIFDYRFEVLEKKFSK